MKFRYHATFRHTPKGSWEISWLCHVNLMAMIVSLEAVAWAKHLLVTNTTVFLHKSLREPFGFTIALLSACVWLKICCWSVGLLFFYETIRRWGLKFGVDYASRLNVKQSSSNDIWHLDHWPTGHVSHALRDEVVISIGGKKHWLWRWSRWYGPRWDRSIPA